MAKIILDMGSGNTCKNDKTIIEDMIYAISSVDTGRHEVILKWQLFKDAPPNKPLSRESFEYAYELGEKLGYETTSSVFDKESLDYLLGYKVPFVKIACRPDLYKLAAGIDIEVYGSYYDNEPGIFIDVPMACIPKYPASLEDYTNRFTAEQLKIVSDHTPGWDLYRIYRPDIIEKHYVLDRDANNPDAGPFAVTMEQLEEVL